MCLRVLHLANQFKCITKIGEALASMENLEQTVRERTVAAEQSRAEAERAKAEATERTEVATAEIADINRREAEASDNRHGGGAVGYVGRPVTTSPPACAHGQFQKFAQVTSHVRC